MPGRSFDGVGAPGGVTTGCCGGAMHDSDGLGASMVSATDRVSDLVTVFTPDGRGLPTDDTVRVAARIVDELASPFGVAGREVRIGASVGVAVSTAGGAVAEALLERADRALYRATHAGRNRWELAPEDEPGPPPP